MTIKLTLEDDTWEGLGESLIRAAETFQGPALHQPAPDPDAPTATAEVARAPRRSRGKVSPAAPAETAGGDDTLAGAAGIVSDAAGLGADRGGAEDRVEPGQGSDAGESPAEEVRAGEEALPEQGAAGDADHEVDVGRRPDPSLYLVQGLAKALGAKEGGGVAALQGVFANHEVKSPKDIDADKLEPLCVAFEAELEALGGITNKERAALYAAVREKEAAQ